MTEDAAWPLAQHVCSAGYSDLPESTIESSGYDMRRTDGRSVTVEATHPSDRRQSR